MNSTIQASFLYSHSKNSNIEDTHFKSITRLKVSSPDDILESLFFDMSNNKVDVSKESISLYLKKHISTHFVNEDIFENIEEHIIRHNDNFLLFAFDLIDETVTVRYLAHTEDFSMVYPTEVTPSNLLREHVSFDISSTDTVKEVKKEKKSLFKNLFTGFKSKKKCDKVEA